MDGTDCLTFVSSSFSPFASTFFSSINDDDDNGIGVVACVASWTTWVTAPGAAGMLDVGTAVFVGGTSGAASGIMGDFSCGGMGGNNSSWDNDDDAVDDTTTTDDVVVAAVVVVVDDDDDVVAEVPFGDDGSDGFGGETTTEVGSSSVTTLDGVTSATMAGPGPVPVTAVDDSGTTAVFFTFFLRIRSNFRIAVSRRAADASAESVSSCTAPAVSPPPFATDETAAAVA
jgi:hypothetical protein